MYFIVLKKTNRKFGNEKTSHVLSQLKEQIPEIIKEKNIKIAKELIENIRAFDFSIVDEGLGPKLEIGLLHDLNENFNTHDWSDRNRARLIINQGLQIAVDNPTKERLKPIIIELFKLLPKAERPIIPEVKIC